MPSIADQYWTVDWGVCSANAASVTTTYTSSASVIYYGSEYYWPTASVTTSNYSSALDSWLDNLGRIQSGALQEMVRREVAQYGLPPDPPSVPSPPPAFIRPPAADERAERLLLASLSAGQRAEFARDQSFTVEVGGRRYRIRHGWVGNIHRINEDGEPLESLCVHFASRVPIADLMLAQKLALETNEGALRRTANITTLRAIRERDRVAWR